MVNVELLLEKLNSVEMENEDLVKENHYLVEELRDCEKALGELEDRYNKYKMEKSGTRCHFCNSKLIWNSDYDFEDYGIFEDEGIIAFLTCPNCNTYAEFFHTIGGEEQC